MSSDTDLIRARRSNDEAFDMNGRAVPSRVWKSQISWKLAAAVFATILIVQGAILVISVPQIERNNLLELDKAARYALAPLINDSRDQMSSPLSVREAESLLSSTHITGVAIYGLDLSLLSTYGETTIIDVREADHEKKLSQHQWRKL